MLAAALGHRCSKHFPWDDGFLLCLAARLGRLNFSQRQIFIHQSVQCSTGQACEGETSVPRSRRGCVLFVLFSFCSPCPQCDCEVGPSRRSLGLGLRCCFSRTCAGPHWGWLCFPGGRASRRCCLPLSFLSESLQLIFPLEQCQAFDRARVYAEL